jgi:hypothetical protein
VTHARSAPSRSDATPAPENWQRETDPREVGK